MIETALRIDPGLAPAHSVSGSLYGAEGNLAAAVEEFKTAARLQPTPAFYINLSSFLQFQGNLAEAITAAQEAVRLAPEIGMTHNRLGSVLQLRGDLASAESEFRKGCDLGYNAACDNLKKLP